MGPHDAISPSADPIGTVELAFGEGRSAEDKVNVGCKCAYIWQTIVEPVLADWHGLPSVEGIAVYGGVPILSPSRARVRVKEWAEAMCSSLFDATAISPSLTVAGALRHRVIPSLPIM